jgi:hypothetical protein
MLYKIDEPRSLRVICTNVHVTSVGEDFGVGVCNLLVDDNWHGGGYLFGVGEAKAIEIQKRRLIQIRADHRGVHLEAIAGHKMGDLIAVVVGGRVKPRRKS